MHRERLERTSRVASDALHETSFDVPCVPRNFQRSRKCGLREFASRKTSILSRDLYGAANYTPDARACDAAARVENPNNVRRPL